MELSKKMLTFAITKGDSENEKNFFRLKQRIMSLFDDVLMLDSKAFMTVSDGGGICDSESVSSRRYMRL